MKWEPVIGIEVHVELKTDSKMFCGCRADFGANPNTNICPVCLALPGALPVPNEQAIEWIVQIGLALDCTIQRESIFRHPLVIIPPPLDLPCLFGTFNVFFTAFAELVVH